MSDDDEGAGGPQIGDLDVTSAAQIRQLRGLIAAGEVVIFSKREAKTLLKIATFFDVDHDESNLKTVIGIVKVCQTFSAFGVLGHLLWMRMGTCTYPREMRFLTQ